VVAGSWLRPGVEQLCHLVERTRRPAQGAASGARASLAAAELCRRSLYASSRTTTKAAPRTLAQHESAVPCIDAHDTRWLTLRVAVAVRRRGFVPLPGMVGYGATVWNPSPTHPPRITEHGAPGGSVVRPTPPELRNMKPGISGITTGIRRNKAIQVK
jgi:hypothetical protein